MSDSSIACLACGRRTLVDRPTTTATWDVGTIIASLIGLLALLVSGYTAWIQREQVRAQVWPNLVVGYDDQERLLAVMNKGVGPAKVQSVQVIVDGKPQQGWKKAFQALGLEAVEWKQSALGENVLSPNETLKFMSFVNQDDYDRFRHEANTRLELKICYCSTLNECWLHTGQYVAASSVQPMGTCPKVDSDEMFLN